MKKTNVKKLQTMLAIPIALGFTTLLSDTHKGRLFSMGGGTYKEYLNNKKYSNPSLNIDTSKDTSTLLSHNNNSSLQSDNSAKQSVNNNIDSIDKDKNIDSMDCHTLPCNASNDKTRLLYLAQNEQREVSLENEQRGIDSNSSSNARPTRESQYVESSNIDSSDTSTASNDSSQTKNAESSEKINEHTLGKVTAYSPKISSDEKPYTTAGAVSSRSNIGDSTQSVDSIIRSIPGGYTQIDQSQGTVSINIRGMTGMGRVNTMIDGVSQTFYGTSADQRYHSNTGGSTSAFGALVDSNFLVGFDMERGTFSGASGSNALMGSANFKTISFEDIIKHNENATMFKRSYFPIHFNIPLICASTRQII